MTDIPPGNPPDLAGKPIKGSDLPFTMPQKGVGAVELRPGLAGAAFFSNKVYATNSAGGVRLTFCETHSALEAPVYRTAVFLEYGTLVGLRDLLIDQLANIELVAVEKDPTNG